MLSRQVSVEGSRSADDVWDRYQRPDRWPEWSPQIVSVDYPAETLKPGTVGTVRGPARLRVRFLVGEIDAAGPVRSWTWTASAAGIELTLLHTVEPVAAGTRTRLVIDGLAPAVLLYLPIATRALRHLVN